MFGIILEMGLEYTNKNAEVKFLEEKEKDMIVEKNYMVTGRYKYRGKKLYIIEYDSNDIIISSHSLLDIDLNKYILAQIRFCNMIRYAIIEKQYKKQIAWFLQDNFFRKAIMKCRGYCLNFSVENHVYCKSQSDLMQYLGNKNYLIQQKDWIHRYDLIGNKLMTDSVVGKGSENYDEKIVDKIMLCDKLFNDIQNEKVKIFKRKN